MRKILVTGAAGFIGGHCIGLLVKRGYEVHAIRRVHSVNNDNNAIIWHTLNLFKLDEVEALIIRIKPTYLMHLAWKVETGLNLESKENEKWLNLSKKIIGLFYKYGGQRLIVSGSCFEYELNKDHKYDESSSKNPQSAYGLNKNRLFQFLKSLRREKDISYVWARIFFTFGPNQKKTSLVPDVISSLKNDKTVDTTDGNQLYDYLYIEDVAMALILLLESSYIGDVNVCSGKGLRLKDLISAIAKKFDKESLIKFGSKPRPANSPSYVVGTNEILKSVTNWEEKVNLDEAILKTIDNFK